MLGLKSLTSCAVAIILSQGCAFAEMAIRDSALEIYLNQDAAIISDVPGKTGFALQSGVNNIGQPYNIEISCYKNNIEIDATLGGDFEKNFVSLINSKYNISYNDPSLDQESLSTEIAMKSTSDAAKGLAIKFTVSGLKDMSRVIRAINKNGYLAITGFNVEGFKIIQIWTSSENARTARKFNRVMERCAVGGV